MHPAQRMSTPISDPVAGGEPTDAVDLLAHQHRRLETLLKTLTAEAQVFYPALHAKRTEDILLQSLEEHLSLKRLLADLLALDAGDPTFTPMCKVLLEQVEHHHGEAQDHRFPKVLKLLPADRRAQLGLQMLQQQASLHRAGQPRAVAAAQTEVAESLDPVPLAD